ncbi:hypothetical protein [Nonomuraea sediminis]|uniref:hypothetical protein n=1 Tax=Nonomuraea sediminis TaxID=2835864 RepID=UPI001BDC79DD|nr:hypothetical protein [Nonomuraea sediminis]
MKTLTAQTPPSVQAASMLWLVAVGAGIFETLLVVTGGKIGPGELVTGVGIRLVVFAAAIFLALRLRQGANWARLSLAVMLGCLGTLSLVIGPIQDLMAGHSLGEILAEMGPWFAGSRVLHLMAVLGAMLLMFQPRANEYFRKS